MIRDSWPLFAAALVVAGLVALNAVLVILGFALAIACGGAMLWARYALRRVTYARSESRARNRCERAALFR